ncbi:MBL fold metallo-hydrolase [Vibrio alginolyticus]|uniref:MBL fold metallo-hydrolase n=1 Tax=Vibrio alginolyticus TaxID=663 RepID=UPI00193F3569|nr:MBL fold metallo-hydrolase [Vibrio parahaemolyticus]
MKYKLIVTTLFSSALFFSSNTFSEELQCSNKDFSLQFLGTGGPLSADKLASSSSVIWYKGKSRIMIDAGGGSFLRFGQAGAQLQDLKLIGISHLHVDHVADLSAVMKEGVFLPTKHSLLLAGPQANEYFPSMTDYFSALFAKDKGAYSYLSGLYNATGGVNLKVNLKDVDFKAKTAQPVYGADGVKVTAFGIPHAATPSLAWRVETAEGTVVISSDQNGSNPDFVNFAKGADILVMPAASDEHADDAFLDFHAPPSVIGKIAAVVNPKALILHHFMGKSHDTQQDTVDIIQKYYKGKVYPAEDLSCYPIDEMASL